MSKSCKIWFILVAPIKCQISSLNIYIKDIDNMHLIWLRKFVNYDQFETSPKVLLDSNYFLGNFEDNKIRICYHDMKQ